MKRKRPGIGVAAFLLLAGEAAAHFLPMSDIPVDRLITNIGKYVMLHPKDANGHYTLGRVHSLAYVRAVDKVPARDEGSADKLPYFIPDDGIPNIRGRSSFERTGKALSAAQAIEHLALAVKSFETTVELDPLSAEHWMSMAYVLDVGSSHALDVDFLPGLDAKRVVPTAVRKKLSPALKDLADPAKRDAAKRSIEDSADDGVLLVFQERESLHGEASDAARSIIQQHWRERAIAAYLKAFQRSLRPDLKRDALMMGNEGLGELTSHEAGQAYLRLVKARGERSSDQAAIDEVTKGLKELKDKKWGSYITPIVLSLKPTRVMSELISPVSTAAFDLDGTGSGKRWPWVNADTGILAWDPRQTGDITSGRQLFGSASWWLLFDNGYRALDALDDNRDGELLGTELKGLAVWFDRNSNGVSDPGEVIPVEQLGIAGIRTNATGIDGGSPCNRDGLRMADGRILPTYDWIARSVPDSSESEPRLVAPLIVAGLVTPMLLAARRRRGCTSSC
jgi:hypothetical protein